MINTHTSDTVEPCLAMYIKPFSKLFVVSDTTAVNDRVRSGQQHISLDWDTWECLEIIIFTCSIR